MLKVHYPVKSRNSILVDLTKSEKSNVTPDPLLIEIPKRQVTKSNYNDQPLSDDVLKQVGFCFSFKGISLHILDNKMKFENLIALIIEAKRLQFSNRNFVNELVHWIHFSKSEAEVKKDGFWAATMGIPGLGRFFGSIVMKTFATAKVNKNVL